MGPQVIFISALALAASLGAGAFQSEHDPLLRGLQKIEGSRATLAFQRPGTRWQIYKTVQLLPLEVRLPAGDPPLVQQMYFEEMRAALGQKGLTVVDRPRADTLIIEAQIYQLIAGTLSVKMGFSDGSTRTLVGALSDFESAKGLITNRDDVVAEARNAFHNWGRLIGDELKDLKKSVEENPIECFKWGKDCS